MTFDVQNLNKCIDCKRYDATPFPQYGGKLAICRNKSSWLYKIGYHTVAGWDCFSPKATLGEERGKNGKDL